MKSKLFTGIGAALLSVALLAGCGGGGVTSNTASDEPKMETDQTSFKIMGGQSGLQG